MAILAEARSSFKAQLEHSLGSSALDFAEQVMSVRAVTLAHLMPS